MPLIEAALAFAITMLALSLIVSSFVEIIHRLLSMREAGLKYMLTRMFDQVLAKFVLPTHWAQVNNPQTTQTDSIEATKVIEATRTAFVERMRANRAPMGVTPKATLTGKIANDETCYLCFWKWFRLWNGRDLASMTPAEFMERLGSLDLGSIDGRSAINVGTVIKDANITGNAAAMEAAATAATAAAATAAVAAAPAVAAAVAHLAARGLTNATDAVLKDIAQKFDAFGKEAGSYFEGRARLLSVAVAIVLAFVVHVDAIDLFTTYLRDPNARAKVIEQSQAVTAQYEASQKAIAAIQTLDPNKTAAPPPSDDVKKQVEALQKDTLAAIASAQATAKQYSDLGVPLGWTAERIDAADTSLWFWTCKDPKTGQGLDGTFRTSCAPDNGDKAYKGAKGRQFVDVRLQVPRNLTVWVYLVLGGLLIGLGSPFWYDVVTSLTSLRGAVQGQTPAAAAPPRPAAPVAPDATNAQPVTPVGAFQVSSAAN
jgi:hypothetical protein